MNKNITEANDGNFDEVVLKTEGPVLVDFWAPWCGPCRRLAPVIDALADEYSGKARVVKLNADLAPAAAKRFGIQGIPTLILFKGGAEKERVVGAASKEAIAALIDKYAADFAARKAG